MITRTYRVEVRGQFDKPDAATRDLLLAEQPQHDYTASAFSPEGTFTYSASLTRFTFRCLIEIQAESSVQADAEAELEGEIRAADYLDSRALPHKAFTTSSTCLQDVKVKRRAR